MNKFAHGLAPALLLCLPLGVLAQSAGSQAEDAHAVAPPLRYPSTFSDYKPWQDIKPGNWRQLNDALVAMPAGRAGARKAHANHAGHAVPAASLKTPASGTARPPAAPHAAHPLPGGKP